MQNFKITKKFFFKMISFILLLTLLFSVFCVIKTQCSELNGNIRCGDINEDGDINVSDGVVFKKYLANIAGIIVRKDIGDVNVDGEVNISDAVILMKFLAGMNVKLGVNLTESLPYDGIYPEHEAYGTGVLARSSL